MIAFSLSSCLGSQEAFQGECFVTATLQKAFECYNGKNGIRKGFWCKTLPNQIWWATCCCDPFVTKGAAESICFLCVNSSLRCLCNGVDTFASVVRRELHRFKQWHTNPPTPVLFPALDWLIRHMCVTMVAKLCYINSWFLLLPGNFSEAGNSLAHSQLQYGKPSLLQCDLVFIQIRQILTLNWWSHLNSLPAPLSVLGVVG